MQCISGLLPTFLDDYHKLLLNSDFILTESQMFELVLRHFDLKRLFEAILKCQYGTPFYLDLKPLPILKYQRTLEDQTLRSTTYFLSVAVPIYRERYLIVKSKKLTPILEEDAIENSADAGLIPKKKKYQNVSFTESGNQEKDELSPKEDSGFASLPPTGYELSKVKSSREQVVTEGVVQDEEPCPKEDSGFSFAEGGPILEQVVFSNPISESAPQPLPLGTRSVEPPFVDFLEQTFLNELKDVLQDE